MTPGEICFRFVLDKGTVSLKGGKQFSCLSAYEGTAPYESNLFSIFDGFESWALFSSWMTITPRM